MRGQGWNGDSQSPNDYRDWHDRPADAAGPHRESGEHHRDGFHQDHHSHHHGARADHHADRGDPSGPPDSDDAFGLRHGHAAEAPVAPHGADDLGWNDAAWGDAGGFEAVLIGHLPGELAHAGGAAPFVIAPIEHLDITFNTFVETTQIQANPVFVIGNGNGPISVTDNQVNDTHQTATADASVSHGFDFGGLDLSHGIPL